MKRLLRTLKRRSSVRRLFAAGLLVIALMDIGSHAYTTGETGGANAWTTCYLLHHTSPSADCPHKRHPGLPEANLFNDLSNHCAVMPKLDLDFGEAVTRDVAIERELSADITRTIAPLAEPPELS
jgi:hypothetical protein